MTMYAQFESRLSTGAVSERTSPLSWANREPFVVGRVTTRDIADFRDHLRRQQGQAVATVNRSLVAVRKFFEWLADRGHVVANPAKRVKELRRQQLAPKGLEKSQVRRLLRELELRGDVRATAIFSVMLYGGLRVADVAGLELHDLMLNDRSGSLVLRNGKGNKQRSVPLPLPARKALQAHLDVPRRLCRIDFSSENEDRLRNEASGRCATSILS